MVELDLDLRELLLEDTDTWPDVPLIGDLLMALRGCAGQRLKVRLLQYHEAPGENWGHDEEVGLIEDTLTPVLLKLFNQLKGQEGRYVTPSKLLTEVWGPEEHFNPVILRSNVWRLRERLKGSPYRIVTKPWFGYILQREQ